MTRRGFLVRGLFGGVLLGTAGLGLWPTRTGTLPRRALKVLDERRFHVLCAVAARTVTAPGADPVEIAHRVDETLAHATPEAQDDLRQLLLLVENALSGLLLDARLMPFTRLGPAAQDAVLAAWRDSRLVVRRSGYHSLRKLTEAAYYAFPESWAQVGYPGPPTIGQPT